MKNKIYFLLIIFCSCNKVETKQQIAQNLINKYLDSTLNNPHSYESVNYSKLLKLKDTITLFDGKPDTIEYNGRYQIQHTYRATNEFGALITRSDWFQIDSAMTKAMCCFREPLSYYK